LPGLKSLDVSYTQITGNGVEHLAALRSLEELAAGGNKFTGASLRLLKPLANLRVLDLNGTQKRNSGRGGGSSIDMDAIGGAAGQPRELPARRSRMRSGSARLTPSRADLGGRRLRGEWVSRRCRSKS
jgi:hypothetical protein